MFQLSLVIKYSKLMSLINTSFLSCWLCLSLTLVSFAASAETETQSNSSGNTALVTQAQECVILLHGLARSASSMNNMETALIDAGFIVANIDYPSRTKSIQQLAGPTLEQGLRQCKENDAAISHVVSHSMGGILYRQYVVDNDADEFGRVVMLAPPNKGSEAVDGLKDVPGFEWLNGPAGSQLGTGKSSVPLKLGVAENDIAIVAGTFSINLILSSYLPDPDDGKVSVESTRLEGMCAHLQVNVSHPFIMKDAAVIKEVITYLKLGKFENPAAEYPSCKFRSKK